MDLFCDGPSSELHEPLRYMHGPYPSALDKAKRCVSINISNVGPFWWIIFKFIETREILQFYAYQAFQILDLWSTFTQLFEPFYAIAINIGQFDRLTRIFW